MYSIHVHYFSVVLENPMILMVSKVKVKVKLSLRLINSAVCHEDIWGSGGIDLLLLTSALDGGEWSTSGPGRFTPGERSPGTNWIGGWMGPRAGLDVVQERKILPLPEFETWPSSP
jgi:hypothetical protein